MTMATSATEHDHPSPPEPDLTPAQIIERAEAMIPALVERQAETELRTFYSPETHREFAKAGLYRILVPRRYGGYEFGIDTFLRVSMALARGCPSTGWMYCLAAAHAVPVATLFDEQAQRELFRTGEFFCPGTLQPSGTAERAPDGGWVINGTWGYCSGAPHATHFLGHTLVAAEEGQPPAPMMFIAPRDIWHRLNDWGGSLGLKGSGSHSIVIEQGHLPDHLTLRNTHHGMVTVTDGTPGLRLHGNPMYGGGQLSFMVLESACVAVGMALGALDAYDELMRSRTTLFPPVVGRTEDPDYQLWYGQASGLLATAEAAVLQAISQWQDASAKGPESFTREAEWRIAMICREAVALCWRAVESHLFPTAGSSAARHGQRIERVWRDMSTMRTHYGFAVWLAGLGNREYTRARFGVVDQNEFHAS
jgi:3-hydroxy-9,10-secoandrosta-1,3,5(10)-triene-9,17-dione monooxygenase